MQGPRLFVCTKGISITGGHGPWHPRRPGGGWPLGDAQGCGENLKHGADQIKLMVTGGVMTEGESMEESQFMLDEIEAATEIAHAKGKPRGRAHMGC